MFGLNTYFKVALVLAITAQLMCAPSDTTTSNHQHTDNQDPSSAIEQSDHTDVHKKDAEHITTVEGKDETTTISSTTVSSTNVAAKKREEPSKDETTTISSTTVSSTTVSSSTKSQEAITTIETTKASTHSGSTLSSSTPKQEKKDEPKSKVAKGPNDSNSAVQVKLNGFFLFIFAITTAYLF